MRPISPAWKRRCARRMAQSSRRSFRFPAGGASISPIRAETSSPYGPTSSGTGLPACPQKRDRQSLAHPRSWPVHSRGTLSATNSRRGGTKAALRNNNTSVGRDFIVPLTVEVVPPQVNLRHLRIRDFDPRRISPVINFCMDSQPFPCGGSGNQTDDHFQTGEGLPSPVLADEGEQAVFNLVPFAGPRLMGLAVHKPRLPEDNYAIIYYPPAPRAMIEVVDPDDPARVVGYGETGRVRLTTLTREFFMPRFLERDEAEREPSYTEYPWDGVRNVRPFSRFQKTVVEGVY